MFDGTLFQLTVEEEKMPEGLSIEEQDEWRERMSDSFDFSYEQGRDEILERAVKFLETGK